MVFQPEGNFQGVALPQLPRPLHLGPAGLSFLSKARTTGLGEGTGSRETEAGTPGVHWGASEALGVILASLLVAPTSGISSSVLSPFVCALP